MSLRRLIGRRGVVRFGTNNYKYNSNNNNNNSINNYYNDNPIARSTHSFHSFSSFGSQTNVGGLVHKSTVNPRSMCYQSIKNPESCNSEEGRVIQIGDCIDLSKLLFTQDRGYLVRCHDHQVVTADHLVGKLVVIYFVSLHCYFDSEDRNLTKSLADAYNGLKSKNCFEVVLVVVDDVGTSDGGFEDPSLQEKFKDIVSGCPSWLAIPFSDVTSRMRLKRKFGIFHRLFDAEVFHIDSTGRLLDSSFLEDLIQIFGSVAYPFEHERATVLNYQDKVASGLFSLKALLGSSERDFVISNEGDEVPITTLENKKRWVPGSIL
ncbi:hypothetical protein POM88_048682 [Heracleum sosnowskyi]|uniref:Uncharacterized protein n=1 Tax=Heracleum sosnowskyi TaxID=360622 RepID=A0AAD8LZU9_9APIA|nr:hypothetical protein POM88_048682 [Heracleum sosnowskyi]